MPLERETLFDTLGDPPYSEADIQAKPMLLMMGNVVTWIENVTEAVK